MKHLGLVIDEQLHKSAKIEALERGKTLTDYICELIRKDLEKNEKK